MALTTYPLTGNFADLIGDSIVPRTVHAVLETNLPKGSALVDKAGKVIHLGPKPIPLTPAATFTLPDVIATNSADINVLDGSLRYRVTARYIDRSNVSGKAASWTTGWFQVTGPTNLADVVGEEFIEPSVATVLYEQTVQAKDDAQAAAAAAVAPTATQLAAVDANAASAFRVQQDARLKSTFPAHVMPQAYGTPAEMEADAGIVINRALVAARAIGAAVYIPAGTYRIRTMVNVGSVGSHLFGAGIGKTIFEVRDEAAPMNSVIGHFSDLTNVRIHDLSIVGTVVDDVTGPRRSRTVTSPGFHTAIKVAGDLAPDTTTVSRDVSIYRVEVKGAQGLPIWLSGVRGEARIESCRFELTMDVGWTWCERVLCLNNTSYKSADNGFSISRGCLSAVVGGNVTEMCAFWGVWVAGFKVSGAATDAGPRTFAVTTNVVKNAGYGGICADEAPKNGVISGNTVDGVLRGPSDLPTNIWGVGILVGGFPLDARQTPTDYAENILVTSNILIDCARGGIQYVGAKNLDIKSNTIIRPGSQFMADGTTAVSATAVDQNFGVSTLAGAQNTNSRITIANNSMIDDRATPYMNYPWYVTGVTTPIYYDNRQIGARRAADITHDNTDLVIHTGIHTWSANNKFTAGATAGSNAATGTVEGFDVNGAAGSTRLRSFRTAGVRRWSDRATDTPETGGDTGSRWVLSAYSDTGTFLYDVLTARRETGTVATRSVTTANRPSATAAGKAGMIYDETLSKPLWSDGTVWRDAMGTAV